MTSGTEPDRFYVFLDPNNFFVSWNVNHIGDNRLSSAAFNSIVNFSCPSAAYDGGTAQFARCIPDTTEPSAWRQVDIFGGAISSYQSYLLSGRGRPYVQEYEGESIRQSKFPLRPSRLSCLYAFKSMDDCERVHRRHGWNLATIRPCRLASWDRTRVARCSMDIVSILRTPTDPTGSQERRDLWRLYWQGASVQAISAPELQRSEHVMRAVAEGDVWEYLIEGQLILDS